MPLTTNDAEFASYFNAKVLGAPRTVDAHDIRAMKEFGLIGSYGFFWRGDIHTILGVLQYEKWREKHSEKVDEDGHLKPPQCKGCGERLPDKPYDRKGRPREYCRKCEPSRGKQRYRRYVLRRSNGKSNRNSSFVE